MRAVMRVLFAAGVALSARTLPAQTLAALPAGAEVRLTTTPAVGPVVQTGRLLSVTRDSVYLADGGDAAVRVARPAIRTAEVRTPDYALRVLVGLVVGATAGFAAQPDKPSGALIAVSAIPTAVIGAFTLPFTRWHGIVP